MSMCVSRSVHLHSCLWRPEVNAGCLLQPSSTSLFFGDRASHWPGAHHVVWVVWPGSPGDCGSLFFSVCLSVLGLRVGAAVSSFLHRYRD